jgi:hypothetical protein
MQLTLKSILQYTLSFAVAVALLVYVFKDMPLSEIGVRLASVRYEWVLLSLAFSAISLWSRAARWNMMLRTIGHTPGAIRGMMALLTGYLANLAIPRMGEVTRCGVLQRTNQIPMAGAFGTVIAERALDLLCLFALLLLTLALEFSRLKLFFYEQFFARFGGSGQFIQDRLAIFLPILIVVLFAIVIMVLRWQRIKEMKLVQKILGIVKAVKEGILSIQKVEQKPIFILHTLNIWVNYFLMTWVVVFAIDETAMLGPIAGLTLLMVGGLGMSAPVQGGIGAFHILVSAALVLYGVDKEAGITYATVLHTSQALFFIAGGSLSLLFLALIKKAKPVLHAQNT